MPNHNLLQLLQIHIDMNQIIWLLPTNPCAQPKTFTLHDHIERAMAQGVIHPQYLWSEMPNLRPNRKKRKNCCRFVGAPSFNPATHYQQLTYSPIWGEQKNGAQHRTQKERTAQKEQKGETKTLRITIAQL